MAGGAGTSALSDKERKDIMDNFQKVMEKPIVIQEEQKHATRKPTNPSKSLSKISESSIKESMSFKDHHNKDDDDSIIDEVEDSINKRESSSGDQIPESLPYDESAAAASVKLTKLR
jgi:cobalamin biosynthesis protein CobT